MHRSMGMPLFAIAFALAAVGARADEIDDYVNAQLAAVRIPGVANRHHSRRRAQARQGYGYANLEHRVPVHPDTVFESGSIGKQFTATATMLMVEDRRLRLDESIRAYFSDAPAEWQS